MSSLGVGSGWLVGRLGLTNFKFDPSKPYAGCRLCGAVYQSDKNRLGSWEGIPEWRVLHNRKHSEREHALLQLSGRKFTPDAHIKLVALGIIDFAGILTDDELAASAREAPRAPVNDVEGS